MLRSNTLRIWLNFGGISSLVNMQMYTTVIDDAMTFNHQEAIVKKTVKLQSFTVKLKVENSDNLTENW